MRHAGLDQNTFWRWMKADAAFAALVEQAEAEAEMVCVTTIGRAAQVPATWQAAKWWLERRRPAQWGRRRRSDSKLLTEAERVLGEQREHDRQERQARRSMDERVSHPDLAVGPAGPGMKLAAFRSALMAGATRKAAAGSAGIDPTTLWRWVNEDPEMAALIEQAEASAAVYFVSRVNDAAQGIWQAAAFLLERRWPSEFARRTKLDASIETLRLAESIAEEAGRDAEELIAEAERIRVDHAKRMRQEPE
jgi:hypothetical protein